MLSEDELRDAVLLVFANKQDLPKAMPAPEITEKVSGHSISPCAVVRSLRARLSGRGCLPVLAAAGISVKYPTQLAF